MASPSAIKSTQDDMINELIMNNLEMEKSGTTKSSKTENKKKLSVVFRVEESQQKDLKKSNINNADKQKVDLE